MRSHKNVSTSGHETVAFRCTVPGLYTLNVYVNWTHSAWTMSVPFSCCSRTSSTETAVSQSHRNYYTLEGGFGFDSFCWGIRFAKRARNLFTKKKHRPTIRSTYVWHLFAYLWMHGAGINEFLTDSYLTQSAVKFDSPMTVVTSYCIIYNYMLGGKNICTFMWHCI